MRLCLLALLIFCARAFGADVNVAPDPSWADEPLSIRITALPPHGKAELRLEADDVSGTHWSSRISIEADAEGAVELASPMRLFWSMLPEAQDPEMWFFFPRLPRAEFQLTLWSGSRVIATHTLHRDFWNPDEVEDRTIARPDLHASYFAHRDGGRHPVVIFLGGIEGGIQKHAPAVFARQGFSVLSLGYVNGLLTSIDGLPATLAEIPVELVGTALDWLAQQGDADMSRVYVIGFSRGSELATLAAAHFPDRIHGLALISPSEMAWAGISTTWLPRSAWTWEGDPVDFAAPTFWPSDFIGVPPYADVTAFERTLEALPSTSGARLPAIHQPVLLLSGEADAVWPSARMAKDVAAIARGPVRLKTFPGAGHDLSIPYLPQATQTPQFLLGGDRAANERASEAAWAEITQFFTELSNQ